MRFLKASALMAVMLASAVLMLGVLSMRGLPARGGSVPASTISGDVNCDGRVDLSDAIYTIQYAFYGGPAPCALALDDYATKDDLAALESRVPTKNDLAAITSRLAALEDSSQKAVLVASGKYTGDGAPTRTTTTGLTGKLREVRIFQASSTASYGEVGYRVDTMRQEGAFANNISFTGTNFTTQEPSSLNIPGVTFTWVAISSP